MLLPLELVRLGLHQALRLLVLELLGLVGPLLRAQLHLEQLVLVEQQLVQRLGLHQALRLLAPELLALVGLLLRAQLHLEQLALVQQQPEPHQALRRLVLEQLGLVDLLQARLHLEQLALVEQQLVQRLGLHQALRLLVLEPLALEDLLLQARLHLE